MAEPLALTLVAPAAVSTSGSSSAVAISGRQRVARESVEVSAFSATSLVVSLERRDDTLAQWETTATVNVTGDGTFKLWGAVGPLTRVSWAISGGSATFGVRGTAHTVYAEPGDLPRFSVKAEGIAELSSEKVVDACIAASDAADGYLLGRYVAPLLSWDDNVRAQTSALATALAFNVRGANPDGPDALIYDARNKALIWFDRVQAGRAKPNIVDSRPLPPSAGGVVVRSNTKRGW